LSAETDAAVTEATPDAAGVNIVPDAAESREASSPACNPICTVVFDSGPDWPSFAGTLTSTTPPTVQVGASLGPAADVCVSPSVPANCPTGGGAIVYKSFGGGWMAGASLPQAHWIWRGDVTVTGLADLQTAIFQESFVLGATPSGTIQVAADDLVDVFVDDIWLGAAGSVTDVNAAAAAQNGLSTFSLTPALHPGPNTITIVGENGPASFAGGCGPGGCSYAQNPAGVIFAGTLTWN
jgi:hypothetical protein